MSVSKIHPESGLPGGGTEDRKHVDHAGPRPEPGFGLDRRTEIDQLARRSFRGAELNRGQAASGADNSAPVVMRTPLVIGAMT